MDTDNLGFPIGLEETIRDFLDLHTNDVVVLYTDGITEAENVYKEMYGLDCLCQVVKDNRHLSAQEICQAIVTDVREFIGSYKIYDDITLVVLKQK